MLLHSEQKRKVICSRLAFDFAEGVIGGGIGG